MYGGKKSIQIRAKLNRLIRPEDKRRRYLKTRGKLVEERLKLLSYGIKFIRKRRKII